MGSGSAESAGVEALSCIMAENSGWRTFFYTSQELGRGSRFRASRRLAARRVASRSGRDAGEHEQEG